MNKENHGNPEGQGEPVRQLRLWPAFAIVLLQAAIMFGPQVLAQLAISPEPEASGTIVAPERLDNPQTVLNSKLLGPAIGTLLLAVWWIFASKAPWFSKLVIPFVLTGIAWLAWQTTHPTMLFAFFMFTIPSATTAWVIALYLFRHRTFARRSVASLIAVVLTFTAWAQFRMVGVDGDLNSEFAFRWIKTDEQLFLSERGAAGEQSSLSQSKEIKLTEKDCPEFRGRLRDGVLRGVSICRNWSDEGLPEIWRQRIGPGWSSFAVADDWIFTQEQRGEFEVVSAYSSETGEERWLYQDKARFTESISGVGPRATPTFHDGRLYTTEAKGIVNCLEASTGKLIWRRSIMDDTGASLPMWGFSSSPLVTDGRVIVFAGGGKDKALIAYDSDDGEILWQSGSGYLSYSSAQLASLHGVTQILIMTEKGIAAFAPETGTELWQHEWSLGGGSARIIQPKVVGNDVLVGTGYGLGTRRINVHFDDEDWSSKEVWTSLALKPYFNDFVVFDGHIFGFDKNIFTCVDFKTGKRLWKRGRYGHGQVLLVEDDGVLLVLSEKGDLVLLNANTEKLEELHRFKAVEGKTWNHPVIANGKLYVRNGVEAACFDISPPSQPN